MSNQQAPTFDQWAVVDVMGHQRFVGHVTEQVIAGHGFIRVDVPDVEAEGDAIKFSKLLGASSIYAISPVTKEIAFEMCRSRKQLPIEAFALPAPADSRTTDEPATYENDYRYDDEDDDSTF